MFENIGSKIKGLAKFLAWVGIIASFIFGIRLCSQASNSWYGGSWMIASGLGLMIGGSLLSWIGSFFLYGYGELIEKTANIEALLCSSGNTSLSRFASGAGMSAPSASYTAPVSTPPAASAYDPAPVRTASPAPAKTVYASNIRVDPEKAAILKDQLNRGVISEEEYFRKLRRSSTLNEVPVMRNSSETCTSAGRPIYGSHTCASTASNTVSDKAEILKDLLERGVITQEEYYARLRNSIPSNPGVALRMPAAAYTGTGRPVYGSPVSAPAARI